MYPAFYPLYSRTEYRYFWHGNQGNPDLGDYDNTTNRFVNLHRPKWRGGAQISRRPVPPWAFFANGLATGRADDFSIPASPSGNVVLGSYTMFNLNTEWQATPNLALKLAVDNLFDRRYYEAYGFAVAGFEPRYS